MRSDAFHRALKSHSLPSVLCLYGAEPYLLQAALKDIEKSVLTPGSEDFNYHVFYAKGIVLDQVIDTALTYPAFAERRLVVIRDAHDLNAADLESLQKYIENPAPETCLVLVAEKIDARRKFFQNLKKIDALVEFKPLSDKEIPGFVRTHLDGLGFSITGDGLSLFVNRVGSSLLEVMTELEKLVLFAGCPRLLDGADIKAVISSVRAENIFEIGNSVGSRNVGKALSLARHLIADGEAPLKILSLLIRHYRQLWKARELQVEGKTSYEIAKGAGVPSFVVEALVAQGRKYSRDDFRKAFRLFVAADLAMKSSGSHPEVVLENLLMQLTRSKPK